MPGFRLLMKPADVIYQYDGSLAGFYNSIHTAVYSHEIPFHILPGDEKQLGMFPVRNIETNLEEASRVRGSIVRHISDRALALCEHVFLSENREKEITTLHFLILGFARGWQIVDDMANSIVDAMLQMEKHLLREAHLFLGFVRFIDCGGKLVATIRPKNFVLPLIAPHFADRYGKESFLIFDKTHHVALVYEQGKVELATVESEMISVSGEEEFYQELWKTFHHAVGIQARKNPRCQMTNMPKRYWENMTEMQPMRKRENRVKACFSCEKADEGAEVYLMRGIP